MRTLPPLWHCPLQPFLDCVVYHNLQWTRILLLHVFFIAFRPELTWILTAEFITSRLVNSSSSILVPRPVSWAILISPFFGTHCYALLSAVWIEQKILNSDKSAHARWHSPTAPPYTKLIIRREFHKCIDNKGRRWSVRLNTCVLEENVFFSEVNYGRRESFWALSS